MAAGHAGVHPAAGKLRRATAFLTPRSVGVECGVVDEPGIFVGVNCQSFKFHTPYEQKATLDAKGHDVFCRDPGGRDTHCGLGNRGEDQIKTLGFGKHVTVGRFRCQTQRTGVTCVVRSSGKGFLISRSRLVAVGGASVSQAPLSLEQFLSPDHRVWCGLGETSFCGSGVVVSSTGRFEEVFPLSLAELKPGGEVRICFIAERKPPPPGFHGPPEGCLQNWNEKAPVLQYGQQSERDGVLCTSAPNGITCVENSEPAKGKGFRVSAGEAVEVG
jgi:hypothetical protein